MLWDILIETLLYERFDDPDDILANKLKDIIATRRSEFSEDRRFILEFFLEFGVDDWIDLKILSAPMAQEEFLAVQAAKFLSEVDETMEA